MNNKESLSLETYKGHFTAIFIGSNKCDELASNL